ncbi:membrane protein / vitamin k-dependent gamma-carboxylase [Paenibacillus alvei TS-15]|uniref:Membrane protein / vitamin k-dependent gamma-carboxylase n=1 Tax=Paenibacillus alvei TS-15 TaxID=1117108 RepID=S9ST20_PAEAL|nr:membrane protein / vitamin k-dependent gamma-carboxylase [Paenibacillus alvei TS-15]
MIFFHLGIGLGMGLLTFSLIMIVMELLVFTDEEYRKMKNSVIKTNQKISLSIKRKNRAF